MFLEKKQILRKKQILTNELYWGVSRTMKLDLSSDSDADLSAGCKGREEL